MPFGQDRLVELAIFSCTPSSTRDGFSPRRMPDEALDDLSFS